jgi:hypothetical protein
MYPVDLLKVRLMSKTNENPRQDLMADKLGIIRLACKF